MDLLSVCKDLIQIQNVEGNQPETERMIAYCQNLFQGTNAIVKVIRDGSIPPVLYVANQETDTPDVAIVGHLDVVPGTPEQFIPTQKDGRLYGRGALDMKSFAAVAFESMLFVLKEKLPISVTIVLETDEETGSSGMQNFVKTHPDFVPKVVLDVDVGGDITKIIDKCKRPVFVELKATGNSAHGSEPWKGTDANERLIQTINCLRKKYPYYSADGAVPSDEWINTMHVGKMAGGDALNVICDTSLAGLDFRLTQDTPVDELYADIEKALAPGVSYSVLYCGAPVVMDQNHPLLQQYKKIAEDILKTPIDFQSIGGATTSRLFAEKGSLIIYHTGSGAGLHAADEYLELDTLYQLADIQKAFLKACTIV